MCKAYKMFAVLSYGRSNYEGVPVLADNVTVVVAGIPARIIKYSISSAAEKISA